MSVQYGPPVPDPLPACGVGFGREAGAMLTPCRAVARRHKGRAR
ncbi:hypothetical protein SAMN04487768_2287 [Burkholderia sp. b13]|nr:hypothetical protein SAMN04487768_2287 [Burkholderia sp. b13]